MILLPIFGMLIVSLLSTLVYFCASDLNRDIKEEQKLRKRCKITKEEW
jgi:hypothetical protein